MLMNLTKGNVKTVLLKFALPLMIVQLLNEVYTLIDSIIVARFSSGNEFAILSNISILTMLGYCLVQGGSIVSNVVFAKMFGEDNKQGIADAKKTFNIVFFIYSTIIALLYCVFSKQLLELIHIPSYLIKDSILVLIVYALNFIPVAIVTVNQGILNGYGDSKTPMLSCIFFQIVNLILDYIAVAIMNKGVLGAAYASLVSVILSACFMHYKASKLVSNFNLQTHFSFDFVRKSLKMVIPSTISRSVYSFGSFFLQVLVNGYGVEIINGYNVAYTLFNFLLCPLLGTCNAYESFCAQNLGANEAERVTTGFKITLQFGTLFASIITLLTFIFSKQLVSLYIKDPLLESYTYANKAFLYLVLNYYFVFFVNCFDAYFKGHQKMKYLAYVSSIILFTRIVLSYAFSPSVGPIFLPVASVISYFIGVIIYLFVFNHLKKENV